MTYLLCMLVFVLSGCVNEKKLSNLHKLKVPIFWAEGHPGILAKDSWTVELSGACQNKKTFTYQELSALPQTDVQGRLTSVTRFSVFGHWQGIPLSYLIALAQIDSTVKYVRFISYNGVYDSCLPLAIAQKEKTILALKFNGEDIFADYGGPIRVFCPYLWGYKSVKSVKKIEFTTNYVKGYWEKRGYSDQATIEPGIVRDMNQGGDFREIPEGEVVFPEDR